MPGQQKKFFSSSLNNIFPPDRPQCRYSSGDVVRVIRNAISDKEYVETYVRNNPLSNNPSADTVFRKIKKIASESGSHIRKGSQTERISNHEGPDSITELIDLTVRTAIHNGAFSLPVNVAIDEHDQPYYGMDNRYLIGVGYREFRGTDKAYRFASLHSVKNGERFVLSIMKRDQLDGIDNSREVTLLLRHALSLGVRINIVLMDRGYLDVGVMRSIASLNLKYIIPAKDNSKVARFKQMGMKRLDSGLSFLVLNDIISSDKESIETEFVHVVYYSDRRHDFSFYTNVDVTENNVMELAETYRTRWGIENGYQEDITTGEKTHSTEM